MTEQLRTPDGRYFVVNGRLWRLSNPNLSEAKLSELVLKLMAARRAVLHAKGNGEALSRAREAVSQAKIDLGERGPVWWSDGAPDFNRHMARTTPYAAWFAAAKSEQEGE